MGRFGHKNARIIGTGMTELGKLGKSATALMSEALQSALGAAGIALGDLDGLVCVPSLSHPHFMEAHYLATRTGLLPRRDLLVRTIDTGGAGPVSALLEARRMVEYEDCGVVAVCAGDAVSTLPTDEFLRRADAGCSPSQSGHPLPSPVIPHGYSRCAEYQIEHRGVTREQLAMVSVLASAQAARHPAALTRARHALDDVLGAPAVAPAVGLLECARRADGGAALIVASSRFLEGRGRLGAGNGGAGDVVLLGGGEASGPLFPPHVIDETMFSCEAAARRAYDEAQLSPRDIDFWGLYDCFPVCFVRALEAVGVAKKGEGGAWVEEHYRAIEAAGDDADALAAALPPVNTHGGLLAFGAPWEVPAMYNVIEAVAQLTGRADERQVEGARRALCYGNGGIFSASAVALLGTPV